MMLSWKTIKSLVAKLAPPSVYNGDVQDSNSPSPILTLKLS